MIKGKNLMLSIDGEIYGYANDCSIDVSTDTSEVTSTKYKHKTAAGVFKEFEADATSISLSSSYVLSDTVADYATMANHQLTGLPIDVKFVQVEATGPGGTGDITETSAGLKWSGKAIITSMSLSAPVDGESTFSVSLQGTGTWTIATK